MSLPKPTAILFDLDGTLVDSIADLTVAANYARAQLQMPPLDEATIRGYVGDGAWRLLERAVGAQADLTRAFADFRSYYRDHCVEQSSVYPHVEETLEALGELPMAVVSNKPQAFTEQVVAGLGLAQYFRVVVGARKGIPVKPDPALLRLACAELDVDPSECWMVGDSPNDFHAARSVGAASVLVEYGLTDVPLLEALEPDALIGDFAALLSL